MLYSDCDRRVEKGEKGTSCYFLHVMYCHHFKRGTEETRENLNLDRQSTDSGVPSTKTKKQHIAVAFQARKASLKTWHNSELACFKTNILTATNVKHGGAFLERINLQPL